MVEHVCIATNDELIYYVQKRQRKEQLYIEIYTDKFIYKYKVASYLSWKHRYQGVRT